MEIENPDPNTSPSGPGGTPSTPPDNYHPLPGETPTIVTPTPAATPPPPRHRGVVNPAPPSTPAPIVTPPPPTGTASPILPIPIYQQGPQRTDVFVPENKTPLPIIYGSQRVGAQLWYRKVQPDNTQVVLYAICHGPINSITNIQIEGKPIATFATTEVYTGTSGQALSTIGSTAEPVKWTSAFPFVAYVVAKFANPSLTHQAPDVTRFTCDVQGMLVRDPRTDATLVSRFYRENPALCLADFLSSPTRTDANGNKYSYGAEIADATLDWSGTITTAANDCDVVLADAVTKRFTIGLAMIDKKPISDWIEAIRQHGQLLRPIFNNGLYQITMDKSQSSSGVVVTSQGNAANILSVSPLAMKPSSQIPSRVIVNFVNAAANYKNDTVQNDDPGIVGGTVEIVERTFEMGQIPFDQATRLAKYLRKRASQDKAVVIRMNAEGLQLLPGMRIPVTSDQWNVSSADMLIADINSSGDANLPSVWDVAVEFYSAGVYDDTQSTGTPFAPPLNPSPWDPATPPDMVAMPYRSIAAAQLQVGTLVPASAAATLGGRILVGTTTRLTADVATGDTTINVAHNNLANNDVVYMETAPGGTQQLEFIKITSGPSGTGPYSYTVARNQNGGGAQAWKQGDCVFDTGVTGAGFIDLYSVRGTKSSSEKGPTIVGNIRNSATYNDWTPRWAIGNLDGLYGYSGTTFGVALGVPSGAWVKIDPTNGVRIGFNATTNVQIDASGNASFTGAVTATSGSFTGSITAASGSIGGWTIGATTLAASGMTLDAAAGKITGGATDLYLSGGYVTTGGNLFVGGTVIDAGNCELRVDHIKVGANQVVGARQAAVADSTDTSNAATQLNALLARLRTHGLIA